MNIYKIEFKLVNYNRIMSYRVTQGTTGEVRLYNNFARKKIDASSTYWIVEYAIVSFLQQFDHPNIIRFNSTYMTAETIDKKDEKNTNEKALYCHIDMPRYSMTLSYAFTMLRWTDKMVLQILYDIFSGLHLCHRHNIIHRDIKSENVMITKDRRAVIIDFSHSVRIIDPYITLEKNMYTSSYRAPEIIAEQEYSTAVDIWAVGILLLNTIIQQEWYELSSGFNGEILFENRHHKLVDSWINIHKNPDLVFIETYSNWIHTLIDPNPLNRPTAKDMVDEIAKFAYENSIELTYNIERTDISARLIPIHLDNKLSFRRPKSLRNLAISLSLEQKIYHIIKTIFGSHPKESDILGVYTIVLSISYDYIIADLDNDEARDIYNILKKYMYIFISDIDIIEPLAELSNKDGENDEDVTENFLKEFAAHDDCIEFMNEPFSKLVRI